MKVAGIKMTDPWASRVLRSRGVKTQLVTGAPVETVVQMERVSIEHHGSEKNYRPLLHLTGELASILPAEGLPHGVQEVTFRSGLGPIVDAYYEFDDVQLAQLVAKGYFTEGFEPPAGMAGTTWELPTTIDALILAPEQEGDTPVVFVTIHGQTDLALDLENSGYDLAEYFENHLTPGAQQERSLDEGPGLAPVRSGAINDLFAADEFQVPEGAARFSDLTATSGEYPVVRASIFEDLMAEFSDKLPALATDGNAAESEADPEPEEQAPAAAEVDADAIYRERIEPGVAKALSLAAESAPEADELETETAGKATHTPESTALDLFDEEDELDVVPLATIPAVEPVWTPEADTPSAPAPAIVDAPQPQRRVQLAQDHERALELADNGTDEPELG